MMSDNETYQKSLDDAIIAYLQDGNIKPYRNHVTRYTPHLLLLFKNPVVEKGSLMKTATSRASIPMELRSKAKRWLLSRKLEPWDDGDVPV